MSKWSYQEIQDTLLGIKMHKNGYSLEQIKDFFNKQSNSKDCNIDSVLWSFENIRHPKYPHGYHGAIPPTSPTAWKPPPGKHGTLYWQGYDDSPIISATVWFHNNIMRKIMFICDYYPDRDEKHEYTVKLEREGEIFNGTQVVDFPEGKRSRDISYSNELTNIRMEIKENQIILRGEWVEPGRSSSAGRDLAKYPFRAILKNLTLKRL